MHFYRAIGALREGHAMRITYAIGDVHGMASLLRSLLQVLNADAESKNATPSFIFLGDLIDKGDHSAEVMDIVSQTIAETEDSVFLLGNHDYHMRQWLHGEITEAELGWWARNDLLGALLSYGIPDVRSGGFESTEQYLAFARQKILDEHGAHVDLLESAFLYHIRGDHCFAHAGIRPDVPLERQTFRDFCYIRKGFLDYQGDFGFRVVHGHTPTDTDLPEVLPNRINLDTCAFQSGRLTALALPDVGEPELVSVLGNPGEKVERRSLEECAVRFPEFT